MLAKLQRSGKSANVKLWPEASFDLRPIELTVVKSVVIGNFFGGINMPHLVAGNHILYILGPEVGTCC